MVGNISSNDWKTVYPEAMKKSVYAATKPIIRSVCSEQGYVCPEICTPEELGGVDHG